MKQNIILSQGRALILMWGWKKRMNLRESCPHLLVYGIFILLFFFYFRSDMKKYHRIYNLCCTLDIFVVLEAYDNGLATWYHDIPR
jgi:hypothetical protein